MFFSKMGKLKTVDNSIEEAGRRCGRCWTDESLASCESECPGVAHCLCPMVANVLTLHCTLRTVQALDSVHLYSVHLARLWAAAPVVGGDTDLGTAQSGSGTRQDNISHDIK